MKYAVYNSCCHYSTRLLVPFQELLLLVFFLFLAQFALGFGIDVHERLVVKSLEEITSFGRRHCCYDKLTFTSSPIVPIVLAQFFINVESHSVAYIFDLCEEQFRFARRFHLVAELFRCMFSTTESFHTATT